MIKQRFDNSKKAVRCTHWKRSTSTLVPPMPGMTAAPPPGAEAPLSSYLQGYKSGSERTSAPNVPISGGRTVDEHQDRMYPYLTAEQWKSIGCKGANIKRRMEAKQFPRESLKRHRTIDALTARRCTMAMLLESSRAPGKYKHIARMVRFRSFYNHAQRATKPYRAANPRSHMSKLWHQRKPNASHRKPTASPAGNIAPIQIITGWVRVACDPERAVKVVRRSPNIHIPEAIPAAASAQSTDKGCQKSEC
jgi:hypothetical protein